MTFFDKLMATIFTGNNHFRDRSESRPVVTRRGTPEVIAEGVGNQIARNTDGKPAVYFVTASHAKHVSDQFAGASHVGGVKIKTIEPGFYRVEIGAEDE